MILIKTLAVILIFGCVLATALGLYALWIMVKAMKDEM